MLDLAYIVLCASSALVTFWVMQCLTVHAGIYCARSRAIGILRLAMAILAASLLFDAYAVAERDANASIGGTVLVAALLVFLISLPLAIGWRDDPVRISARN